MELVLNEDDFENSRFYVAYGTNRQAMFIIVDEEFLGDNRLGRINRIVCLTREIEADGTVSNASTRCLLIGMGDEAAGARSDNPSLRGKALTRENMGECVVELYE
jgi:hypothetical protein